MAGQPHACGRLWWLRLLRRRAPLIAGLLLLPAMLAVAAMAGPGRAMAIRPATSGQVVTRVAIAVQMIAGYFPLGLTPPVQVPGPRSSRRHVSQSPASARMPGSGQTGQPRGTSQRGAMGQGHCHQQSPAYRPGRVFAKGNADGQSGGPAATLPGGPAVATPPDGPAAAATPPGPAAARPAGPAGGPVRPGAVPLAGQATPVRPGAVPLAGQATPVRPGAVPPAGQATPPRAVPVSPSKHTADRGPMRGIPQTQRQAG